MVEPALGLAEVLVVAGDVGPGQPGPHVAERRRLLPRAGDRAVGDVAGVADDVGVQRVDRLDHAGRPARPVDRAVVGVGQQHHPQPVEPATQPGDRDVDPPHPGTRIASA